MTPPWKKISDRRLAKGKCPKHENTDVLPGQKWCQICSDKSSARHRKRLAEGICPYHPKNYIVVGKRMCADCLSVYAEARENGKCFQHPNRDAVPNRTRCSECAVEAKFHYLKKKGLSKEELAKAAKSLENFGGRCESCGTADPIWYTWCLDHDDKTKKFRGIICPSCNIGIGQVKENPEALDKMAAYVRKHKKEAVTCPS